MMRSTLCFIFSAGLVILPLHTRAIAADDDLSAQLKKLAESISAIEKGVRQRDDRIKDLEAQIKALEAKLAAGSSGSPWSSDNLTGAFLGVEHTDVPADLLAKLSAKSGALLTDVFEAGPAAKSGLQKGDVILSINGKAVASTDLTLAVRNFKPGTKVNVKFARADKQEEKEVELIDKEAYLAATTEKKRPVRLGVLIAEDDGLVVKTVDPGLTASAAKLQPEDRVLAINGTKVSTLDEVGALLGKLYVGDRLSFEIDRGGRKLVQTAIAGDEKTAAQSVEVKKRGPAFLGAEFVLGDGAPLVESVDPDTVASAYALRKGDRIKAINGKDVSEGESIVAAVGELRAGERVTFLIDRGGRDVELADVVMAEKGEKVAAVIKAAFLGIDGFVDEGGVVVDGVVAGTAAGVFGILKGDVLKRIDDSDVTTEEALRETVAKLYSRDTVSLTVEREGRTIVLKDVLLGAEGEKIERANVPGRLGLVATILKGGELAVVKLNSGEAADLAGLKRDDVLLAINGNAVKSFADLRASLKGRRPGELLKLKIKRGDAEQERQISLTE